MTSKQEKLAAARKKLKEFQGKNREIEGLRSKNISDTLQQTFPKESSQSTGETLPQSTVLDNYNVECSKDNLYGNSNLGNQQNFGTDNESLKKNPDSFSNELNTSPHLSSGSQQKYHNIKMNVLNENPVNKDLYESNKEKERNFMLGYVDNLNNVSVSGNEESHAENSESVMQFCNDSYNSYIFSDKIAKSQPILEKNYSNIEIQRQMSEKSNSVKENSNLHLVESKELVNDSGALNDVKSLQLELQNHIQTINILVQQRNDAQIALAQAQNLLTEKSDDIIKLNQYISSLNSSVNNINYRLLEADETIKKLNNEKNTILEAKENIEASFDKLQAQYDIKKEECSELKSKYDETDKECQSLLYDLHQVQSQLSICQIQMQQLPCGDNSNGAMQTSELQNENLNLKQKLEELEKQIEIANAEKEQSSQNFHVYAQRCNSQLNNLNSQVKTLCMENERLKKENSVLFEKLSEIEDEKKNDSHRQHIESEKAELLSQINALTEENKRFNDDLKRKEEELTVLYNNLEEKESELKNMEKVIKAMEAENRKLISEIEMPKPNERLLAAMESDKVAAAKAVSQNQKLKEQIVELEEAFMKLSQEKLELTDQLAHEKHINSELQKAVKISEHSQEKDHDHFKKHDHHLDDHSHDHNHDHDHDHSHDSQCLHSTSKTDEPLVNDSNEIEELRNIVRQLQDDKIELKARLNSLTSNKTNSDEKNYDEADKRSEEENEEKCENTKLLLSLMEEKVRKTMNELATLDEEKEKLEHLVLQLQGETETIGEYITLYQKQRMLLRQRAQEKDNQLLQLSKDKEELRSKLVALDELVQHLLAERNTNNKQSSQIPVSSAEVSEHTAERIRALITEIGTTNLISSNSVAFEHCSCCSGRLITI